MTRKLFHFTALALFLPAVIVNQRIMVFGSNLAIVCFIIIEFSKKFSQGTLLGKIHEYEERYLDDREKNRDGLILSHLFLLLGCSIATITSYILIEGEEFSFNAVLYSLSGLIFVGIGDSMAALGGRSYGLTKWPGRHKSREGSFFCLCAYMTFYVLILVAAKLVIGTENENIWNYLYIGIEIFFAGSIATIIEAFTLQFDNFLCPQV